MTRKTPRRKGTLSKVKQSKPGPRRSNSPIKPIEPNTLRIQAQIAMLKRALLAADDDSLPHRAVCDYLKTLSQMAKVDGTNAIETDDLQSARSGGNSNPPVAEDITARQQEDLRRQLQRTVHDIYGLSTFESDVADQTSASASAQNSAAQ